MPAEMHRLHGLLMDLFRTAGLLQLDQVVPDQPVSLSQAFALHELDPESGRFHGASHAAPPLSQRDLAQRLRLEKSSVSRMVADLERRGLLVRERDPDNRRLYRLRLTEAGRALHARMGAAFHDQYQRWVDAMTPAEQEALLTGLAALVRSIREDPAATDRARADRG